MIKINNSRLACVFVVCCALLIAAVGVSPVYGWTNVISANVAGQEGTPLYDGVAKVWNIPGARLSDGFAFGPGVPYFDISPLSEPTGAGSLVWTGNPLSADQSTGYGLAIGLFGGGGVLSMTGTLYDFMGPVANGLLFSGTVGSFTFRETGDNQNNMVLEGEARVTPTGGWLYGQGYLAPAYDLSFQAVPCRQDGADVVDFKGNLVSYTALQFFMVGVPEPSAALLVAAGAVVLTRRRRS